MAPSYVKPKRIQAKPGSYPLEIRQRYAENLRVQTEAGRLSLCGVDIMLDELQPIDPELLEVFPLNNYARRTGTIIETGHTALITVEEPSGLRARIAQKLGRSPWLDAKLQIFKPLEQ